MCAYCYVCGGGGGKEGCVNPLLVHICVISVCRKLCVLYTSAPFCPSCSEPEEAPPRTMVGWFIWRDEGLKVNKRRYFILENNVLYCYKRLKKGQPTTKLDHFFISPLTAVSYGGRVFSVVGYRCSSLCFPISALVIILSWRMERERD